MLAAKGWKPDLIVRFFLYLVLLLTGGGLLVWGLTSLGWGGINARNFWGETISMLLFHAGTLLLVAWLISRHAMNWAQAFGWVQGFNWRPILLGVTAGAISVLVIYHGLLPASLWLLQKLRVNPATQAVIERLQNESTPVWQLVWTGITTVVMAPIVEEILFRGILLSVVRDAGFARAARWGSAILWAVTHSNAAIFIPLLFLGLMLALLYERTGNLMAPISAHAVFNLMSLIAILHAA